MLSVRQQTGSSADCSRLLSTSAPEHLLESLAGFVALLSGPDNIVEHANAAFLALIGREASEVLGRPAGVAAPETRECFQDLVRTAQSTRQAIRLTGLRVQLGWALRHHVIDVTCSPVFDAEGAIAGGLLHGFDMTEQQRLVDALMSADECKDKFMAVLAHELRVPLAAIRTAAKVLAEHPECQQPVVKKLSAIVSRQVVSAVGLIDELNDVNGIRLGKMPLQIRKGVVYQDVVREAAASCQNLFDEQGQEFSLVLPSHPILVDIDRLKMHQVLCNLMSNASKYTPRGGHIQAELAACGDAGQAVLTVKDDGVGLTRGGLERIFDLYYQDEHASTGLARRGLGIGLALVREIVSLHGGRASAHSDGLALGSTFSIHLPLHCSNVMGQAVKAQDSALVVKPRHGRDGSEPSRSRSKRLAAHWASPVQLRCDDAMGADR